MQLTVVNLTSDTILLTYSQEELHSLVPSRPLHLKSSHTASSFTLATRLKDSDSPDAQKQAWYIRPDGSMNASWQVIKVDEGCPWRIYRSRVSRKHHKLLILAKRNLSSFLSEIPDSVPLSSVVLPGTHDTMAFYGWPISQCQSLTTPLTVQLQSGIRILDVRLAVIKSRLIAYHGIYPQRTPFQDILSTVHGFLTAPDTCCETIVMSIKQEDFMYTPTKIFSKLVHAELLASQGGMDMWFLENRVPTLGEVRGKVLMFSRFGGDGSEWEGGLEGLGIHPTYWPDSERRGFSWLCKNTLVMTHDWYAIPSFLAIPEKVELSTQILLPPPHDLPFPTLKITYFSAASFPLAFPPLIARGFGWPRAGFGVEGVNSRVGRWLLEILSRERHEVKHKSVVENSKTDMSETEEEPRIRGWTLMDFYEDPVQNGLVPLLVECNFRGRRIGEEGWI